MPRQNPTLEDIQLPGIGGPRPVAGYDVSAFGQGGQALARAGQTLGGDIQKSAQDIAETTTFQHKQAVESGLNTLSNAYLTNRNQFAFSNDPADLDNWNKANEDARNRFNAIVPQPDTPLGRLAHGKADHMSAEEDFRRTERGHVLATDQAHAASLQGIETLGVPGPLDLSGRPDPTKAGQLYGFNSDIDNRIAAGHLTRTQGEQYKKQGANRWYMAQIDSVFDAARAESNPERKEALYAYAVSMTGNYLRNQGPSGGGQASTGAQPTIPGLSPTAGAWANDNRARLQQQGVPITVTSALRTPEHNAAVGGARGSQHLGGNAIDVSLTGLTPQQQQQVVSQFLSDPRTGGFGYYPNSNSIHVDVRQGDKAAWGTDYHGSSVGKGWPAWLTDQVNTWQAGARGTGHLSDGAENSARDFIRSHLNGGGLPPEDYNYLMNNSRGIGFDRLHEIINEERQGVGQGGARGATSAQSQPAMAGASTSAQPGAQPGAAAGSEGVGGPLQAPESFVTGARTALAPQQIENVLRRVEASRTADAVQQARAAALQEKVRQKELKGIEDEYLKDAYSDNPQKSVTDVIGDPRLKNEPDTENKIIAYYQRANKPDPIARISTETTRQFIDKMSKPYGDPDKLNSAEPIKDAFIEGRLSRLDYDWLNNKFTSAQTPEGEKWEKHFAGVEKAVRPKITKTELQLGGIVDTEADQRVYDWHQEVERKKQQWIKEGKDPHDLLDSTRPEYVGSDKALENYRASMERTIKLLQQAIGKDPSIADKPAAGAGFNVNQINTVQDAVAAYNAHKITKEQADQLAIERGWGVRRQSTPAGEPPVRPPISRPEAPPLDHGAHSGWRDGR